jgi:hypothetical protein
MTAMKVPGVQSDAQWTGKAHSREEVEERLRHWRDCLLERRAEGGDCVEVLGALDRWLDELSDLIGR